MSPKRVAFVLPSFAGGGAERVLLTFARTADRGRVSPTVVALDSSGPWRELLPADMPLVGLGTKRIRNSMFALRSALRRLDPDIVVSTIGALNLAVLALRPFLPARTRIFVREANTPKRATQSPLAARVLKIAYRRLYRRASGVIVPASYLGRELSTEYGVPAGKIAVVHNPVDEDGLRAAAVPVRRMIGAGARFVAVGRLTHQKGFDRLLAMLAEGPRDAGLIILGDGPDRPIIEKMRRDLGLADRVEMPGFRRDAAADIAGADALLLPSRWEGLPNVALEALALGTPVIATPESGGVGEIAELASPGAVVLAEAGAEFAGAMARIAPGPVAALRPSRLPKEFQLATAVARFLAAIEA